MADHQDHDGAPPDAREWPAPSSRAAVLQRVLTGGHRRLRRRRQLVAGVSMAAVLAMAGAAAGLALSRGANPAAVRVNVAGQPTASGPRHGSSSGSSTSTPDTGLGPPSGLYRVIGDVWSDAEHPVQLCLGDSGESYGTKGPPRCDGIPLRNFTWASAGDEVATSSGETYVSVVELTGTYDGTAFTVTGPVVIPNDNTWPGNPPAPTPADLAASCPEPAGGWKVANPALVSESARTQLVQYLARQPDFSMRWWAASQYGVPRFQAQQAGPVPPAATLQVITFTGDLARHRQDIAKIWGGPVCVEQKTPGAATLVRAAERVTARSAPAGVHVVSARDTVVAGQPTLAVWVYLDDAATKAWIAANAHGVPVQVTAAFQPVG